VSLDLHEARDALAANGSPLRAQVLEDSGAAIGTAAAFMGGADQHSQLAIADRMD
jgi:hypothetical protein